MNEITQPRALKASSCDPDALSHDEAMADGDPELWIEAAKKEIKLLEDLGTWTEVDVSEATARTLPLAPCAGSVEKPASTPSFRI
jgi:hypothetical protein